MHLRAKANLDAVSFCLLSLSSNPNPQTFLIPQQASRNVCALTSSIASCQYLLLTVHLTVLLNNTYPCSRLSLYCSHTVLDIHTAALLIN